MKSAKLFALLLISVSLVFSNCTPDQNRVDTAREIMMTGTWSVDYYFEGMDQTATYTNYEFTFNSNGTISCSHQNHTCAGTWNMIRDVNRNEVVQMQFTSTEPALEVLNAQWNVVGKELTVISMKEGSAEFRIRK